MEQTTQKRYKATLAYDGTDFSGFQIQPKGRTVQGEIEKVLAVINKDQPVRIHPAGRTDAGVHAWAMVIHFDFPKTIPEAGLLRGLNVLLPPDISVWQLAEAPSDFHARYHAVGKTYTFRVDNRPIQNPFLRNHVLHHPYEMDKERIQDALDVLIGTHDFTSFCSVKSAVTDKVRTIYEASVEVGKETDEWLFTFTGDGFLYNMIRIIMGTVLKIGDGRADVASMREILQAKDRNAAGKTIAPNGLRLDAIYYDDDELKRAINKRKNG